MSIDRGYDVLEVIRKYLALPNVLPVVTGDIEQYMTFLNRWIFRKLDMQGKDGFVGESGKTSVDSHLNGIRQKYLEKGVSTAEPYYSRSIFDIAERYPIVLKTWTIRIRYVDL